jgi:hypothetical protein
VDLVEWKDLLACPICGKTYDPDADDSLPQQVTYGPAVNRDEDTTQIARMDAPGRPKQKMRTEFDDAFFKKSGIVVIDDKEDLPLSIDQERKRTQRISSAESRGGDFSRTRTRVEYREMDH